MKLRFEIERKLLRSSVDRDGFLRRGWTRACLNDDGKIPSEREKLTRFVLIGPSSLKQSFKKKGVMESRGTLFTFRSRNKFVNFSESGWNKIGYLWWWGRWRNRSGESDGKNLVRMRSVLSLNKSRNVLARLEVSLKDFDEELCLGRVFQSVRGLADDSVTRLDTNEDLALEMRDPTELHWALNFRRSKGDFQQRQHCSSRLRSCLAWRILGLIHGVWGLWTTVLDLIGAWMSRMDLRVEEN